MILAIDPGKEKCGMAVLSEQGTILSKKIVPRLEAANLINSTLQQYKLSFIVVGKSAFGKEVEKEIMRLDIRTSIIYISEKNSTLEARSLYWHDHQPKGIWRLIPTSWRVPPVPIDDYAAVVLGKRYLKG